MPPRSTDQPAADAAHGDVLPYLPALDGLRAIALGAVLLYHAHYSWLPGGFLGVDVFFVLSGYLITTLLLNEWNGAGSIDLVRFWVRRGRRLLPALGALLFGVLTFSTILGVGVPGLRADAAAAAAYVTNWWLVVEKRSYFEVMGRLSPLQHLWSLAVEEQFYLLWPPIFVVAMRRWPTRVGAGLLAAAAASTLLMAVLFDPHRDPSRLYFGTDTRISALLIGAALSTWWRPGAARWHGPAWSQPRPWHRPVAEAVTLGGIAVLGLLFLRLDEYHPLLYRGGFAVTALVTATVIGAVVHPSARWVTRVLSSDIPRWVGTRSYSAYLWHWPVFLVTRPGLDVPLDVVPAFILRLLITFALAEASYRWIERPLRAPRRSDVALGIAPREVVGSGGRLLLGGSLAGLLVMAALVASATREPGTPAMAAAIPSTRATAAVTATEQPPVGNVAIPSSTLASEAASSTSSSSALASQSVGGWRLDATSRHPGTGRAAVLAVGDSVMLGAQAALVSAIPHVEIDGEVGIQPFRAIQILHELRDGGRLGDVVVLQIGNNGLIRADEFEEMMRTLADVPQVIVLTVNVPRPWEQRTNAIISAGVRGFSNVSLVDWKRASADHPEYFIEDGVHLQPVGAAVYAALIAGTIR